MATFTYMPDWGATPELTPRVRSVAFGDGYSQDAPDGLNTILPVWKLTFSKRTQAEAQAIYSWLIAQNAHYTRFDWAAPGEGVAAGELFATGDGARLAYSLVALSRPCTVVGTPTIYRTDWQGTYQLSSTARTNIALQSQTFTGWTPINATATANTTTSPDGTNDAGTLVENTANSTHYVSRTGITFADNTTYCMSIWAKRTAGTRDLFFYLYDKAANQRGANFNLGNGTVSSLAGASSAGVVAYPNGWYRLYIVFNSGAGANPPGPTCMMLNGGVSTYTGDGTSSVGLFGLQVEVGSATTSYIPTTTAAVTVTDYTLSATSLVTLAANLASGAILTWSGAYTRKHVAKFGVPKPDEFNSWSISADFREVPL